MPPLPEPDYVPSGKGYVGSEMHAYAQAYAAQLTAELEAARDALLELVEAYTTPFPGRSMFPGRDECIAGQNEWAARQMRAVEAARVLTTNHTKDTK